MLRRGREEVDKSVWVRRRATIRMKAYLLFFCCFATLRVNNWKNGAGFPQQPPQRGQQQWPSMSGDPQWPDGRRGGGPQRGPQGGMPQWPGRHEADDLENRLKEVVFLCGHLML